MGEWVGGQRAAGRRRGEYQRTGPLGTPIPGDAGAYAKRLHRPP